MNRIHMHQRIIRLRMIQGKLFKKLLIFIKINKTFRRVEMVVYSQQIYRTLPRNITT